MYYRVGLVLAEGALESRLVRHIAPHDLYLVEQTGAHQLAFRDPIAHQASNISAGRGQSPDQPGPHQARSACNKNRPVEPKFFVDFVHNALCARDPHT